MANEERVDELRRRAFGRDSSAQQRSEAIDELRRMDASSAASASPPDAPSPPVPVPAVPAPAAPESDPGIGSAPDTRSIAHRGGTISTFWLLPIILISLVLGLIGGNAWAPGHPSASGSAPPTAQPEIPVQQNEASQPVGDLIAVGKVLARPRTTQDTFPKAAMVPELRASSVRYLGGNASTVKVWIGLDSDNKLCLLAEDQSNDQAAAGCTSADAFAAQGLSLGFNAYNVSWDGENLTLSSPYGYPPAASAPTRWHKTDVS